MKPTAKAATAQKSTKDVEKAVTGAEQLQDWKAESTQQFDQLKQKIEEVSLRVTIIEQGAKDSPRQDLDTLKSVKFEVAPDKSVILEGEEGYFPKAATGAPQRKALKTISNLSRSTIKHLSDQNSDSGSVGDAGGSYGTLSGPFSRMRGSSILKNSKHSPMTGTSSICTVWGQAKIASKLSMPIRILGTSLGFITVVLLWEATDGLLKKLFPVKDVRLISYLGVSISAAVCLCLSDHWVRTAAADPDAASLLPSFAYALSTLFLAIGSWGSLIMSVRVIVPASMELFCYAAGGLIALVCTIGYAVQTKHNVLLDIASCATTLGLHEDSIGFLGYEDYDDEAYSQSRGTTLASSHCLDMRA